MSRYLDELLRWPFNPGETFALLLLALGIAALSLVPPDHSHRSDNEEE